MSPSTDAIKFLHYVTPVLALTYYTVAHTLALCWLHRAARSSSLKARRRVACALLLTATITYVAQGVSLLIATSKHDRPDPPQHEIVYLLVSAGVYGFLAVNILESKTIIWHPIWGAGLLALPLEATIVLLQVRIEGRSSRSITDRLALQVGRLVAIVAFVIFTSCLVLPAFLAPRHSAAEDAGLLDHEGEGNGANYAAVINDDADSDADSDFDDNQSAGSADSDEDPRERKELLAKQKERLEKSGNYLSYLREYQIFVKILWPSRDRFIQVCFGLMGLVLIADRFLRILVPRQLGIIVEELTESYGTGVFPWKSVGIYMLLAWLNSEAGIDAIESLAEIPIQQFSQRKISEAAFEHVMRLSMDFHNEKSSGELITAINQGHSLHDLLEYAVFRLIPMFVDLVVAFVYVYTLFDVYMSLILVMAGVGYSWLGIKLNTSNQSHRRRYNSAVRKEWKVLLGGVYHWPTVSEFNRADYECERYHRQICESNRTGLRFYFWYNVGSAGQSLIMLIARLAAYTLAFYRVSQGSAPVGNLITLTAYWSTIEYPLTSISRSFRRISSNLTDAERLLQVLLTKPSVTEIHNASTLEIKGGQVEFENVEFAYDERRPILKNVSFKAKPGEVVALVGETGGGKSTIMRLLYRYYDVKGGSIRIDGQDIRGVTLDSLRNAFGMVPQDPSLFNMSILENVRYARLDATDEEVHDACRAAAIHEKILSFPDGYKATVGERGVKLSGGELQRVAIARAIVRRPRLVLLDEATSMIDAETEALIQTAFRSLAANRTTFVIAHRLSTIQHADLILVVQDGKIAEHGTHAELLRLQGKYTTLWSKQLSREVREVGSSLEANEQAENLVDLGE